jgi:hypothetical protein
MLSRIAAHGCRYAKQYFSHDARATSASRNAPWPPFLMEYKYQREEQIATMSSNGRLDTASPSKFLNLVSFK